MGRKVVWATLKCAVCGIEKQVKPCVIRQGRRYCSRQCRYIANPFPDRHGNKYAWKGDSACRSAMHYRARKLIEIGPCVNCLGPGQVVHHIDENPKNNALENLQRMCRPCHVRHHHALRKNAAVSQAQT